jgi:hypothetical protein
VDKFFLLVERVMIDAQGKPEEEKSNSLAFRMHNSSGMLARVGGCCRETESFDAMGRVEHWRAIASIAS